MTLFENDSVVERCSTRVEQTLRGANYQMLLLGDSSEAAQELHLLELGHTRVALLMAKTTWTTDAGRRDGYRTAHAAAGLRVDRRLVVKIPAHATYARASIGALLDEVRPTAIFAANNLLLLRRLEDPTCGRTAEVLEPSLVVRGPSAPPPA
jgi:hypothetical protein